MGACKVTHCTPAVAPKAEADPAYLLGLAQACIGLAKAAPHASTVGLPDLCCCPYHFKQARLTLCRTCAVSTAAHIAILLLGVFCKGGSQLCYVSCCVSKAKSCRHTGAATAHHSGCCSDTWLCLGCRVPGLFLYSSSCCCCRWSLLLLVLHLLACKVLQWRTAAALPADDWQYLLRMCQHLP